MGATNTTANYNLSQFIGTDKPAWLQDYNGDMLKIDTGINAAKVAADGAQNTADGAQNSATTANNAITNTINPAISSLNSTVGNQGGAINTINSLIGNGTPTTTDQTIIGAINEINAELPKLRHTVTADGVKTAKQLLNELYPYLATTADKVKNSIIIGDSGSDPYIHKAYNKTEFSAVTYSYIVRMTIDESNSSINNYNFTTQQSIDVSSDVPASGYTYKLYW